MSVGLLVLSQTQNEMSGASCKCGEQDPPWFEKAAGCKGKSPNGLVPSSRQGRARFPRLSEDLNCFQCL